MTSSRKTILSRRYAAFSASLVVAALCIARAQNLGTDSSIEPGDDFFAYANGEWLKATVIPVGASRFGARNEIEAATQRQLADIFSGASSAGTSYGRVVADFRTAYLNESVIEAKGLAAIRSQLDRIKQLHDSTSLSKMLGSELGVDVDPLDWGVFSSAQVFGLAVQHGIHGETHHIAYLLQGGLGLPDRDHYLNQSQEMTSLRAKYQTYIGRLLELAGFDRASDRARGVLALETEIAKTHSTTEISGNEKNADNAWSRADFSSKAPGIDWNAFFVAAGLSTQGKIVVWQPAAISGEAKLIATQPIETWRDYLSFHLIDQYAVVLPKSIAEAAMKFRDVESLVPSSTAREQRANDATNKALPEFVGRLYVDKYFPAKTKARVQTIAANVIDAFSQRIGEVQWLTPEAKSQAAAKLKTLYFGVGYPESWAKDSNLAIRSDDAAGNLQRIARWRHEAALRKLSEPVDLKEWSLSPQRAAAILNFSENAYNFSAALLQVPKFDPEAPDAANYGAIGAIIGHEVSHFIDTLGADYDSTGATRHWWSDIDHSRYKSAAERLDRQFSSYRPFPDLAVDGKASTVENVADLGGLAVAFDAYRRTLGNKINDKQFVHEQDRLFFLGFGRSWRAKANDDALRKQATSDHAPERYRIATVRNIDAWYEAFNVTPGQKLYLDPKDRVRIW